MSISFSPLSFSLSLSLSLSISLPPSISLSLSISLPPSLSLPLSLSLCLSPLSLSLSLSLLTPLWMYYWCYGISCIASIGPFTSVDAYAWGRILCRHFAVVCVRIMTIFPSWVKWVPFVGFTCAFSRTVTLLIQSSLDLYRNHLSLLISDEFNWLCPYYRPTHPTISHCRAYWSFVDLVLQYFRAFSCRWWYMIFRGTHNTQIQSYLSHIYCRLIPLLAVR